VCAVDCDVGRLTLAAKRALLQAATELHSSCRSDDRPADDDLFHVVQETLLFAGKRSLRF